MPGYAPYTLRVIDEQGQEMFRETVPFEAELDVRGILERAFIIGQAPNRPDPLVYQLQYYGYSESLQFPGYLGYEVERFWSKASNDQFYWELKINGVAAQDGADSMQPLPGSDVTWVYTPTGAATDRLSGRAKIIHARRAGQRGAPVA